MKVILFTHESDIDGLGNVVLAKMAFDDLECHMYPTFNSLEGSFRELLEQNYLDSFDKIFVTDLALANPSLEMVANNPNLRTKIQVLDHHAASIKDGLNIYDFTKIEEIAADGHKRCGTEMFYEYLTTNGYLERTPILDDFVELTRLEDTWDWKNEGDKGLKAHDIATLLNGLGVDAYIEAMYKKTTSQDQTIELTSEEAAIVEAKKREYEATLQNLWESAEILVDEFGNIFGITYADYQYRNELAEYVRKIEDKKGIKYLVIVALEKGVAGQKSYRSIDDDFDVNEVAMAHGGGGHPKASSVNLTVAQKAKVLTLQKREGLEYIAKSKYIE